VSDSLEPVGRVAAPNRRKVGEVRRPVWQVDPVCEIAAVEARAGQFQAASTPSLSATPHLLDLFRELHYSSVEQPIPSSRTIMSPLLQRRHDDFEHGLSEAFEKLREQCPSFD
jgi:hypothetical protein